MILPSPNLRYKALLQQQQPSPSPNIHLRYTVPYRNTETFQNSMHFLCIDHDAMTCMSYPYDVQYLYPLRLPYSTAYLTAFFRLFRSRSRTYPSRSRYLTSQPAEALYKLKALRQVPGPEAIDLGHATPRHTTHSAYVTWKR